MKPYVICKHKNADDLELEICELMEKGYIPTGSPLILPKISSQLGEYLVMQAMYRKPIKTTKPRSSKVQYSQEFEVIWRTYPKRRPNNPKRKAYSACLARIKERMPSIERAGEQRLMLEGARRYAAYCDATGKTGTEFVYMAATFFGPDRHYENDWAIPSENTNALPKRDEDLQGWAIKNGHRTALPGEDFRAYRRYLQEQMK